MSARSSAKLCANQENKWVRVGDSGVTAWMRACS